MKILRDGNEGLRSEQEKILKSISDKQNLRNPDPIPSNEGRVETH